MSTFTAATLVDQINALELALPLLPEKDRDFAKSLIDGKWGFKTKGTLSPKQVYWVVTLLERAMAGPKPAAEPTQVGNFQKVYAIFATAAKKLKYPKIKLVVGDCPVVLQIAGPKPKQPGVVNVTDGGPFGSNKWFGRVAKDGSWQQGKQYDESAKVADILGKLAEDPIKTAGEYGKLTGCCCFCNKVLSDPQSAAAGFGATCAQNFGLLSAYKQAKPVLQAA